MNGKIILLKGDVYGLDSWGGIHIKVDDIQPLVAYHKEYLAAKKLTGEKADLIYKPFDQSGVVRLRGSSSLPEGVKHLEVYIKVKQYHLPEKRGYSFDIFLLKEATVGWSPVDLLAY